MKIDLSNSEWKLMNRLWQTSPMTITELTAALREDTGWSKNTVITMLSRLEARRPSATRKAVGPSCISPPWPGGRHRGGRGLHRAVGDKVEPRRDFIMKRAKEANWDV